MEGTRKDLQGERENGVIVFNFKNIEKEFLKNEERAGRCPPLKTTAGSQEDWNKHKDFPGRKEIWTL